MWFEAFMATGVKQLEHEADHLLPFSTEVNSVQSFCLNSTQMAFWH
jgi:hypothetical protein